MPKKSIAERTEDAGRRATGGAWAGGNRRVGDLNHSGALAAHLAKHFGLESAKKACAENQWDAVLSALKGGRPGQGGV